MASATTRSASGTGGQVQGGGPIIFAAVLLVVIGCFNLLYGIAAIANSHPLPVLLGTRVGAAGRR